MKRNGRCSPQARVMGATLMALLFSMPVLGWAQDSTAEATNAEAAKDAPVVANTDDSKEKAEANADNAKDKADANEKQSASEDKQDTPKVLNVKRSFFDRHPMAPQEAMADRLRVITEEYVYQNKPIPEDEISDFRNKAIAAQKQRPCMTRMINYSDGSLWFHNLLLSNKSDSGVNSDSSEYEIHFEGEYSGEKPVSMKLSKGKCAMIVSKLMEDVGVSRLNLITSDPVHAQSFSVHRAPWLAFGEEAVGVCANADMTVTTTMETTLTPDHTTYPPKKRNLRFVRKAVTWDKSRFPQFVVFDMKYDPYERCEPIAYETELMSPLPGTLYYYGNKPFVLAEITRHNTCRLYDIGLPNDAREETMVDCRYLVLDKPKQVDVTANFAEVYACTYPHPFMHTVGQCEAAVDKKYGKQLDAAAREMANWRYSREHQDRYNRAYDKYQYVTGKVEKEKYACHDALAKKVAAKYKAAKSIQKVNQFYKTNTISPKVDVYAFKLSVMCAVNGSDLMYFPKWLGGGH